MSDNHSAPKKAPPSFSGYEMPTDINVNMYDGRDEVTRRSGAFQPSFEPISAVAPVAPSFGSLSHSEIRTLQAKAAPQASSTPTSTKAFVWKLQNIPTLPEFHPLERSAVLVDASPEDVSARISSVLRERSIEAVYDDDKAKVKCITTDGVDFRVRLYRGRGDYSDKVIVEVQRRFGSDLSFMEDTSAILDAAQGKEPAPMTELPPAVSDSEDEPEGSPLAIVAKMLAFEANDSHNLALQTLVSLTSKMGGSTARRASNELLQDDSEVGKKVIGYIVDPQSDDVFDFSILAWTILANALAFGTVSTMVREAVRPHLLQALTEASTHPRRAHQAARCLEFWIPEDHDVSQIHSALEKAHAAGLARHAGLERQAQRCLDLIP